MTESKPLVNAESVAAARQSLLEQGKRVTYRSVIKQLGGGSFSSVGPLLQALEKEHGGIASDSLPESVAPQVTEAAVVLWRALAKEADRVVDDARARFERDRRSEQQLREAAEALLARTQDKLKAASDSLGEARTELGSTRSALERLQKDHATQSNKLASTLAHCENEKERVERLTGERDELQAELKSAQASHQRELEAKSQRLDEVMKEHECVRQEFTTRLNSLQDALRSTEVSLAKSDAEQASNVREIDNLTTSRDALSARLDKAHERIVDQERALGIAAATNDAANEKIALLQQSLEEQRIEADKVIADLQARLDGLSKKPTG